MVKYTILSAKINGLRPLQPCNNSDEKYILPYMRKPVFPRILLLLLLYCAVFVVLVSIQFAKRGGFTIRAGNFIVSGQRRLPGEGDQPTASNEYLLDGDVHVFFGGIDFGMISGKEDTSFFLIDNDGLKVNTLPERMFLNGDSILFLFPGEVKLEYSTQYISGSQEMRISGYFPEDIQGAELPIKPLRKTVFHNAGDSQIIVSADGINYAFNRSQVDEENRMLLIAGEGGSVSYRVIPDQNSSSPVDFILPEAQTANAYSEALSSWRDQNFSFWNRTVSDQNNEDVIIAYAGEAIVRGTYKAAIAAVPQAFLRSASRTYESSVYLGGLDDAYRSLVSSEREKITRLSRQINEKSLEFLKENRVIEYLAVRGQNNFIDAGAELVRSIDPAVLALDIAPGILEGYVDWKTYRPNNENPFERLVDQACFVITGSLHNAMIKKDSGSGSQASPSANAVFSLTEGQGDTEFNLRLGRALLLYAMTEQNETMAGIGRSLILSVLSLGGSSGTVNAGLVLLPNGEITEDPAKEEISTARLCRILAPLDTFPKAIMLDTSANGIWAWTAAQAISTVQQNDTLDINVRFPAGETHYMLIRGIRQFSRIQLYGMDFRSDPQFERYDSSGWVYYPQEQILVLKMKHRTAEERVRIIYREEARPAPAAAPPPAATQPAAPAPAASQPAAPAPAASSQSASPAPASPSPPVSQPQTTPQAGQLPVPPAAGTQAAQQQFPPAATENSGPIPPALPSPQSAARENYFGQ